MVNICSMQTTPNPFPVSPVYLFQDTVCCLWEFRCVSKHSGINTNFFSKVFQGVQPFQWRELKILRSILIFKIVLKSFFFVFIKKPKVLRRRASVIGLVEINFQNNNSVSNNRRLCSFIIRFRKWPVIPCNDKCDLLLTLEKSQNHPQIMTQLYSKAEL